MCLSKVYLREGSKDRIVVEEASGVMDNHGTIEVYSIFGENKKVRGYYIKEVDFLKNSTILGKKKRDANE